MKHRLFSGLLVVVAVTGSLSSPKFGWTADASVVGLPDPGGHSQRAESRLRSNAPTREGPSVVQIGKTLFRAVQGPKILADGMCEGPKSIGIFNGIGAIVFTDEQVDFLPSEFVDPNATKTAEFARIKLDSECESLLPIHYSMFGEAIALFAAADAIGAKCGVVGETKCAESIFQFADVSRDGELSVAEVSRVFRALTFFVSVGINQGLSESKSGKLPVITNNVYVGSAAIALIGPTFAKNFISSVDFDANGTASFDEIIQDRRLGLTGATGALRHASTDTVLKGFAGVVSSIFGQVTGLLR